MHAPQTRSAAPTDPPAVSLTLNVEPWSALSVARAAEAGKWRGLKEATVVFGKDVDMSHWCRCCTGGEPPVRTWQLVMTKAEREAAMTQSLPKEELALYPRTIVQSLLLYCPLESLTITVKSPTHELWPDFAPNTAWNLFADMPVHYGVPEKVDLGPYSPPEPLHEVPPLRSLHMVNWCPTVADLQHIADCFPSLTRLTFMHPLLIEPVKEALDQWFEDRLPFMEIKETEFAEADTRPCYRADKKPPHVYE